MDRWEPSVRPRTKDLGILGVHMAKIARRGDLISHQLLELLDFREMALFTARPNQVPVDAHLENATLIVRNQRERAELLGEGGQQLLTHPGCPEQPIAQPAIGNGDVGRGCDGLVLWLAA